MPYIAKCQIKIKTDNQEEFEKFLHSIRSEYGDLNVESLPEDVDISFDLSFKTEFNYDTGDDE